MKKSTKLTKSTIKSVINDLRLNIGDFQINCDLEIECTILDVEEGNSLIDQIGNEIVKRGFNSTSYYTGYGAEVLRPGHTLSEADRLDYGNKASSMHY